METRFIARLAYSAQRIANNGRPEREWDELSPGAQEVHQETVLQVEAGKHELLKATGSVFVEVCDQALLGRKAFQRELVREVSAELSMAQRMQALEQKIAEMAVRP
jgi:hypothetical protein